MTDQVAFAALIKELKVYTTVDLDKEARITMKFIPADEVIDSLNKLIRGDQTVMVGVVSMTEGELNNRENNHGDQAVPPKKQRKPKG